MDATIERVSSPRYAPLGHIASTILRIWPEHEKYLSRSFAGRDEELLETTAQIARMTVDLVGDRLEQACENYKWMCDRILEEEIEFRRSGKYRHSRFAEVVKEVYGRPEFMSRYVDGILISQVTWTNHTATFHQFLRTFLPTVAQGSRFLEIGPGHGLGVCFAAGSGRMGSLTCWDVSETSLEATRAALARLGVNTHVDLKVRDVLQGGRDEKFDVVVMGEVLEHLEQPDLALQEVFRVLDDGGVLFVNVPVNSPAPDHIYLLKTPEEATELVRRNGFEIVDAHAFPMSGYTLERAIRSKATISCVVVGRAKSNGVIHQA
jgi:2-polyprenyl-3-methyl-5-hydroxy-6-metoxy-1,4-benzoquinol methylase